MTMKQAALTGPIATGTFHDSLTGVLADPAFWGRLADLYSLTGRQVDLAQALCRADGTKEIARQWKRSIKTIEACRLKLYDKLDVDSAVGIVRRVCGEAADYAMRQGVEPAPPSRGTCPLRQAAEQMVGQKAIELRDDLEAGRIVSVRKEEPY